MVSGYVYAVLLAVSTFAGSLCSCHFNLLMTELGIKVRAALTTAVYDKVSLKSSLLRLRSGEIIFIFIPDRHRLQEQPQQVQLGSDHQLHVYRHRPSSQLWSQPSRRLESPFPVHRHSDPPLPAGRDLLPGRGRHHHPPHSHQQVHRQQDWQPQHQDDVRQG